MYQLLLSWNTLVPVGLRGLWTILSDVKCSGMVLTKVACMTVLTHVFNSVRLGE